ncbi:hypothetical protein DFH09DRAFT_4924, partial [Mycena vulgaris]
RQCAWRHPLHNKRTVKLGNEPTPLHPSVISMRFTFSTLFLALASLGFVAAIPVEINDVILAREPIIGPCPAHLICAAEN